MSNTIFVRTLFFVLASLLVSACSSNAKQRDTEKPNVLIQHAPVKTQSQNKSTANNDKDRPATINISTLKQRMSSSSLSPWSSSKNAYVFYAGGILVATLDDNKLLKILPDPAANGQKPCLFSNKNTAMNNDTCQALLSALNQLLP